MDKVNLYSSNQPAPLYNPTTYVPPVYDNNSNSSFTKIDSATLINQQPYINYNQPKYSSNSSNIVQSSSLLSQESGQYQSNGTQVVGNGTSKSNLGSGEEKYKNKYSFKRNTVTKSGLLPDAKTGRVQQSRSFTINQQKVQNNTFLYQNKETTGNTLNQYTSQTNNIYTPRPPSTINNIETNYIPTPINVVIPPPSPVRPPTTVSTKPLVVPINPQSTIIPTQPQPIIIPSKPQPQPIIIPSTTQPQVVPFVPQPTIKPIQSQPVVNPAQSQSTIITGPSQQIPGVINPQKVNPVIIPEFVDKSQQYIKQIWDLRLKIEELESQKLHLIDQVRYYERQRFQTSSEQTLRVYKQEIQTLKSKISQISASVPSSQPSYSRNDRQIEQLKEKLANYINREKEYEYQLIQAQNHIIYLENSSKAKPSVGCSHQNFENEIKQLRQTIANYTEHIEHIELEKQEYKKYIINKEQELTRLYEENNILKTHLQQVQKGNVAENGINPNQYYSLLAEFGKKDLQVIILMQEISRLQKETLDSKGFLVKAEDYIIELQQQLQTFSTLQAGHAYDSQKLQIAFENELQLQQHKQATAQHQNADIKGYEDLLLQYGKKQLQSIILLQEINRLKTLTNQLTVHLQNAQDYIFNTQQHVKGLQAKINQTPSSLSSNTQLQGLRFTINDLQGKLATSNKKLSAVETKQATHFKEVQALQLKYKAIISQLDKNYSQLLSEKNSLAEKLVHLQRQSTKIASSNVPTSKFIQLQQANKRLTIQIAEITEHLVRAESHIKMNSQRWQKGYLIDKELSEKISTLELLNKEIQIIKDQNVKLNDSNIQLQKTIQELSNSQANSQNMTIVIRQKEQVEVLEADRHAQIQQLEQSLANYTKLYNQSQAKLAIAEKQIQGYKQQIKKFAELEGYLKKAEQFITQQELKWNSDIKNYETENLQIKNHLMGAQVHIKELEERLTKLNNDYIKIQQQNKAHIKENHEILQALNKAQKHIFEMEKLINVK